MGFKTQHVRKETCGIREARLRGRFRPETPESFYNLATERAPVSRVRRIRTHGVKGVPDFNHCVKAEKG